MSTITSKYHSTCRICSESIHPGDSIEWQRGIKPAHTRCANGHVGQVVPVTTPWPPPVAPSLVVPTVHLNGTSGTTLQTQISDVLAPLRTALDMLREASPHGRDYYVQDDGAYALARAQYEARCAALQAMLTELTEVRRGISLQVNAQRRTPVVAPAVTPPAMERQAIPIIVEAEESGSIEGDSVDRDAVCANHGIEETRCGCLSVGAYRDRHVIEQAAKPAVTDDDDCPI